MAVVLHLVYRDGSQNPVTKIIDGITHAVIAIEDGTDDTDAKVRARGATILNAELKTALPAKYFNANEELTAAMATAGEYIAGRGRMLNYDI